MPDESHPDYLPSFFLGHDAQSSRSHNAAFRNMSRIERRKKFEESRARSMEDERFAREVKERFLKTAVAGAFHDHGGYSKLGPIQELEAEDTQVEACSWTMLSENGTLPIVVQVDTSAQTDVGWWSELQKAQQEIERLKSENRMLREERTLLEVRCRYLESRKFGASFIKGDDEKTKAGAYTGFRTYSLFEAVLEEVKEKASCLTTWRGEKTKGGSEKESKPGPKPWKDIPVEDQFFAVLAWVRLGLHAFDVADRMDIPESSYSRLFST